MAAAQAAGLTVELEVEADFADLFEVKESRVGIRPRVALEGGVLSWTTSTARSVSSSGS